MGWGGWDEWDGWDGWGCAPQLPSPFSRARGSNFLLGLFSRHPYYLSAWRRLYTLRENY